MFAETGLPTRMHLHSTYSDTRLSLKALNITETELALIASAATIGDSNSPNTGYRTPAAMDTPKLL